jgi:type IV secretory pathway VirB10-like protein
MRNLFSSAPDDPVDSGAGPGGWAGLSGAKKLAIVSGVAVAGLGAVMWPNFGSSPAEKPASQEPHLPATISDYQAPPPPPPVQNVVARAMGDPPAGQQTWQPPPRPVPTEMAIYVAKAAPPAASATPGAASGGAVSAALGPNAAVPTHHATIVQHPGYVIRAGDVIPCLPVDAQNSERPSFTTCRVPVWFRSTDQRRGLLPPGSRLFGSIKTGLAAGQTRLGIAYSLVETPWFNMPVEAPVGDALGRGGADGDVNTFFWDRAGAVALYALIDTTVGIGQNAGTNALSRSLGNNNSTNLNFQGASQSLAGREFDATINRPPVLTRDQALPVTVTVGARISTSTRHASWRCVSIRWRAPCNEHLPDQGAVADSAHAAGPGN